MTTEQFEAQLRGFGESISNMQPDLQTFTEEIQNQIKQDYGRNGLQRRTSSLYNSIDVDAPSDTTISISMNDYGLYNNYGVLPTPTFNFGGDPVMDNNFGTKFRYNDREFGLPSRNFFTVEDIADRIAIGVAQITIEYL